LFEWRIELYALMSKIIKMSRLTNQSSRHLFCFLSSWLLYSDIGSGSELSYEECLNESIMESPWLRSRSRRGRLNRFVILLKFILFLFLFWSQCQVIAMKVLLCPEGFSVDSIGLVICGWNHVELMRSLPWGCSINMRFGKIEDIYVEI